MKGLKLLPIFIALLVWNLQFAQEDNDSEDGDSTFSLESGPIESQFDYVAKKSGNYRAAGVRYEVVKVTSLEKLKKNVLDSLSAYNKTEISLKSTIKENETTINDLNQKLDATTKNLTAITEEKDSMFFLGMQVSKVTYNLILWSIIGGLLTLLLLFIYRFRKSNVLTQEAKTNLAELETEFEDHRRRALEREQKISRQLMDELNKHKK
ncbi:tRNA (guanine-N1)-methyltransferase [Cellulophaga omnivescoria]|uniref:tRNA (guanine-N1)-methyltransferase n=1 Tax=Cellulophaga omnivescoria TaxID=1888890 RepID=UPI00098712E8|nr:tRNA (guanine-N1)-methyltransferase [Cellulophaga omnivescoria]WBU89428.1 tRNA (guanine-N1)-methyltransferase [Cellulophaga omnivescoria]WKB81452.1 tRNA (guanine-N1)-methyltransferase [Cellulophaga lytica]